MLSVAAKGPCTSCVEQAKCKAFSGLDRSLFRTARFLRPKPLDAIDTALDQIVANFFVGLNDAANDAWRKPAEAGVYLSTLFDFCVNGIYVGALPDFKGGFTQQAIGCGTDLAFFPFVWMCPECVAKGARTLEECYLPGARREDARDYPRVELLAKPGGRAIGDAGIKVLRSILRAVLKETKPTAIMREGGGEHGEFDLTITDSDALIFAEVKAKPLISYPLRLHVPTGIASSQHAWIAPVMKDVKRADLFLAASGSSIPVALPAGDVTWPLYDFAAAAKNPAHVRLLVENWRMHLEGYRQWEGEARKTRWHRFGCGNFAVGTGAGRIEKRVANTKELPGLDRTDDIKKGAAQLLKFSRFKFDCKQQALRAILIGNTYAETHGADYIDPLVRLHVTRADEPGSREEWIFDAVIGFTQDKINTPDLRAFFGFQMLVR